MQKKIYLSFISLTLFYAVRAQQMKYQALPRPNILIIVIDDASPTLSPPDVPSYVKLPAFDSIRINGVTIHSAFCVYPLCNPARSSYLTSLYPHSNGAIDNSHKLNPKYRLFTQALDDAGYHVQVCGKLTNTMYQYQPWAENKRWMCLQRIDYTNPTMFFSNGTSKVITGNTITIIGDTTNNWLSTIDTPFCFWEGVIVPHSPTEPLPSTKKKYNDKYIPLENYTSFTNDYPSFTYADPAKYYTLNDSNKVQKKREHNLECFVDIDASFTKQFNTLKSRGLLDNTFIIIIDDNGYLNGEHLLLGKEKPYKEALNTPCYIQYKPWFAPGSENDSTMFTSIDVGPTILDVARVHDAEFTAQQTGNSLRTLIQQGKKDSMFYYEDIRSAQISNSGSESPSFRGVRSFSYNYVKYNCTTLTEQLFDLQNDPDENTNVINKPSYALVVNRYRFLFDSLANATHDTLSSDNLFLPCKLISDVPPVRNSPEVVNSSDTFQFKITPNPADAYALLKVGVLNPLKNYINIEVTNNLGLIIYSRKIKFTGILETLLDVKNYANGLYVVTVTIDKETRAKSFLIDHD
ncbi:MAG: sulfatase-like hydrolase/transferase [Chitinophagales bacterium]|nr:sulfatase-like hydrolase/transferase [Chitinophagales bacterium]